MYHFWIKSYDYSMEVLYPKIVNAYMKFAQNCVYYEYKCNFSVLAKKHTTLFAKNVWHPYNVQYIMYCNILPYRESTGAVCFSQTEWYAILVLLSNKFGISALLFWHTDVHTKFA